VKICACGKRAIARGMCTNCYAQWRRTGGVQRRVCKSDGCGKYATTRGWCPACYWRVHQHGTTQKPKKTAGVRHTFTAPAYVLEQAMSLLDANESMSAFVVVAVVNEIARRRTLRRVAA
jgi:hypothetical protein